ncbi:MAG TPA: ECF transporter S component [Eubacteriales bacterium]|nr:ECF transporter S component [Eubacteriales bacterium]
MDWKSIDKRQLITILSCFVGTFLVTALFRVDMPFTYTLGSQQVSAGVYATLGDACIYVSVLMLGAPWGVIVSALGAALADLVVGSKLFIIGSLIIKSAMALFVAAFALKCDDWKKCLVVAGMTEAIMVLGYFVYDLLIVREFVVAGLAFLTDLAQGVVCGAAGAVILRYMPVMEPEKMLQVRRAPQEREE